MAKRISRREFMEKSAKMGISTVLGSSMICSVMNKSAYVFGNEDLDIAVAIGNDYSRNTGKAVELLGGISRFVPLGSKVAILPNTQSKHPGTYTKPEIVRAVIRMCKKAGAKEVNCLSWLKRTDWEGTGLAQAVEEEGANLKLASAEDESFYKPVPVPEGKALKQAQIMKEFFNNDVFINMPVTKDHAGNQFTGTMKNLMGLNFRVNNRSFHKKGWREDVSAIEFLDQCIADLNTVINPTLCIVDATEFITTNGPFGPGEIIKPQKVVAGVDRVAVDSYCATLWDIDAKDIVMINRGHEHKLGEIDLKKLKVKEVKV